MDRDESFLRTILERPDDDGPRLVYADWLEECGECPRAELIRLQCQDSDADRVAELVAAHGRSWAGPTAMHAYAYAFRRGFVEEITISAAALLAHGEEVFDRAPVRLLRVIGARAVLDRLVRWPLLDRLAALHLTGAQLGDDGVTTLAACRHLANLRTLRLGANAISDAGVEALADSPWLENVETLVLRGNLIGDAGLLALATTHPFGKLKTLDLSDNMVGEAGAEALARSPAFRSLTRLDLSNQFKGWTAGLALRGRPFPIQQDQRIELTNRFGPGVCIF